MRDLDSDFITEKNKQENAPIFLYSIYDYDGASDLFLTNYNENVTFDSREYARFPIEHEYISENTQGQIDSVKLTLGNVSRLIQAHLENYDFRGVKVEIKQVFRDLLDDPDAFIKHVYYVDSYMADQQSVEFTLTSKFDVLEVELPARKFSRNTCGWKFKSTECGYIDGETECNKTLARCRELENSPRIGAFPSVPSSAIYSR